MGILCSTRPMTNAQRYAAWRERLVAHALDKAMEGVDSVEDAKLMFFYILNHIDRRYGKWATNVAFHGGSPDRESS